MTEGRPEIAAELRRAVLVEAGHRCAIPACRHTSGLQVAHIVPWRDEQEHTFANLIALCANCHVLYDIERKIDRKAMRQYKHNLGLLNSRYGDIERRVIEYFALHPDVSSVPLPGGVDIFVMYLLRDGYLEVGDSFRTRAGEDGLFAHDVVALQVYRLTEAGRRFVTDWAKAAPLDG